MNQAVTELAGQLWSARRSHTVVDAAGLVQPVDMAAAYAVQDEIMRLCGGHIVGFKVGSTSEEAQRFLGTTEPGSCPVPAPYMFESAAEVAIAPAQMPSLEGEFACRLGRDLPPRSEPYGYDEVRDAIDAVAGAIEVVGTRMAGGLAGKGRYLVTADCGANIALVVGAWHTGWRDLDLRAHPVAMTVNGEVKGQGIGARALGDPLNVMVWIANKQSGRGRGLKAGEIVSTGTCTGLDPVAPGDVVVAQFGILGDVTVRFTDATA